MSAMDPDVFREMDAEARAVFGKGLFDLTAPEMQTMVDRALAEAARLGAVIDQAEMVVRDVEVCGCSVEVPVVDGVPDIARGRIRHTCGRSA